MVLSDDEAALVKSILVLMLSLNGYYPLMDGIPPDEPDTLLGKVNPY